MLAQSNPTLEPIYQMFSGPVTGFDEEIARVIVNSHVADALTKTANELARQQLWFAPLVVQWQQQEHPLADLWRPAFASLEEKTQRGVIEDNDLIAAALAMHESISPRSWQSAATGDNHFRLHGHSLPPCAHIRWDCDQVPPRLYCDGKPISSNDCKGANHSPVFEFEIYPDTSTLHADFPVSSTGWNQSSVWSEAIDLLHRTSPEYAQWACRLVNTIVPLDAPRGHQISASHRHRRGEVLMSWDLSPSQLAENLVHEASHQHFFMATMLGDCDDGTDRTLYFSPVVKTERPLSKILLAYHAFANVILFFRQARDLLPVAERNEVDFSSKKIMDELELLERPLRESSSLTILGQQLWCPLAAQLKETNA